MYCQSFRSLGRAKELIEGVDVRVVSELAQAAGDIHASTTHKRSHIHRNQYRTGKTHTEPFFTFAADRSRPQTTVLLWLSINLTKSSSSVPYPVIIVLLARLDTKPTPVPNHHEVYCERCFAFGLSLQLQCRSKFRSSCCSRKAMLWSSERIIVSSVSCLLYYLLTARAAKGKGGGQIQETHCIFSHSASTLMLIILNLHFFLLSLSLSYSQLIPDTLPPSLHLH